MLFRSCCVVLCFLQKFRAWMPPLRYSQPMMLMRLALRRPNCRGKVKDCEHHGNNHYGSVLGVSCHSNWNHWHHRVGPTIAQARPNLQKYANPSHKVQRRALRGTHTRDASAERYGTHNYGRLWKRKASAERYGQDP